MTENPKRRWFRFRLSSALILTAIVACGMATQPHVVTRHYEADDPDMPWILRYELSKAPSLKPPWVYFVTTRLPNPDLVWPAVALAAFLAWKAARAMVERRRRHSAAPE